jgi:hypothetical protein
VKQGKLKHLLEVVTHKVCISIYFTFPLKTDNCKGKRYDKGEEFYDELEEHSKKGQCHSEKEDRNSD